MAQASRQNLELSVSAQTSGRVASYLTASDGDLVLATLAGDLLAFDELIRRYRNAIFLVAFQCTNDRAVAEDVAQDAFLLAFQNLSRLTAPGAFGGWLRAIVRNRAIRLATRESRSAATEDTKLDVLVHQHGERQDSGDPLIEWEKRAENSVLWDAFDKLPADYREVLFLHHCEEWPLSQIATFFSVPETTIKGRLWRAREALRRSLSATPASGMKGKHP